jgi:hypothetical protein
MIDNLNDIILASNKLENSLHPYSKELSYLMPYIRDGVYDKKLHKKISSLSFDKIDIGISFLMKQTKMLNLLNLTFSNYKICKNEYAKIIIDNFINDDIDKWCCMLQYDSGNIFLDILSHESFIDFIELNKTQRYICIPVSLSPEYNKLNDGKSSLSGLHPSINGKSSLSGLHPSINDGKSSLSGLHPSINDGKSSLSGLHPSINDGHVLSLIIDNVLEEVYLFDSNGKTNYFNNNMVNSDRLVNLLFKKYFIDLENIYNIKYKFIENYIYNPDSIILNKHFKDSSGYCMILSILFPHYLSLTQLSIYHGIKTLSKLKENEFIDIINKYSIGFNDILIIHK